MSWKCPELSIGSYSHNSAEILKLLRSLPEPGKRSVVMVTHDAQAAAFGERVIHIRDGLVDAEEPVLDQRKQHVVPLSNS